MTKWLFLLFLLLLDQQSYGFEFRPASLDHLSLDVAKFGANRELMTPEIPVDGYKGRIRLNWDVGLLNDTLKWRNKIHTEGTDAKLKTVGWNFVLALPVYKGFEVFYEHHSQHTMDQTQPTIQGNTQPQRYPVQDSYGVRLCFYGCG